MQSVVYEKGYRRIFYKATNFAVGKSVTAYIWTPQLTKSSKQSFVELSDGLYYLDYNFNEVGQYIALFYEDDKPIITRVFTVQDSTKAISDEAKRIVQMLIALFK